ncbi:hypothetical protein [Armatimonas rosea]|uniref:Tetratricopeptide repeat protein n=1 Tax=Armatimonas rosea TaxID=685828 RepID=A0A7W9W840_ARMRO|nr:hypothetical protein [Armatimonas rosea]MBB6052353.1 hypothetical protein [Armatimonas rosea]
MPVSPADPSHTQYSFRFLEHQHALELRCGSASEASTALAQLAQRQAAQAATQLSTLQTEHPPAPDPVAGESLFADAQEQQATFEALTVNYDPMLREMAIQGRQALKNGICLTGREQVEELRDALKLLQGVLANPIGSRNYAVWFEVAWLQWSLGLPLTEATDSFYHTARLSNNTNPGYRLRALRHQAFLLGEQGKWDEAWTVGQTATELSTVSDPHFWIEQARYALLAGHPDEATTLLKRALDHDPTSAFALYSEPDLAPLYGTCSTILDSFAASARETAHQELERLQEARKLNAYLEQQLGITLELPTPLVVPENFAQSGIFQAHSLARRAHREATQILDTAIARVEKEKEVAQGNARRLKIQIDQALSEKTYYEGSLKNIEEHARESGFSLHPYTFNNPFFRRRNQKAEDVRFAYESFKQKLTQCDQFLKEHLPAMEATYDKQESRHQQVAAVLEQLIAQRAA